MNNNDDFLDFDPLEKGVEYFRRVFSTGMTQWQIEAERLRADAINDAHRVRTESVRESSREFANILVEMGKMFSRKNAAYGDDAIGDTGMYGISVRMNDKVKRLLNITKTGAESNDETIEDTLIDLAVYAVIGIIFSRGKWGNKSEK